MDRVEGSSACQSYTIQILHTLSTLSNSINMLWVATNWGLPLNLDNVISSEHSLYCGPLLETSTTATLTSTYRALTKPPLKHS